MTQPSVRLALCNSPAERNGSLSSPLLKPAILVSFVYLEDFLKNRPLYNIRDWVLDSGAFSAFNSGTVIDLQAYIEKCKELMACDPLLTEVYALDVIGNYKASLKNCEKMWEAGVQAIPTFHPGEPESALSHIAERYPKIAVGGVANWRGPKKLAFARQCFARVWPKRVHGFGFGTAQHIFALPWHSVDASNWELGPTAFGQWKTYGKMSVRGSNQDLRSEVEHYLSIEQRARIRWKKQMAELETTGPSVRLAEVGIHTQRKTSFMTP